jgi:hypothetical protein
VRGTPTASLRNVRREVVVGSTLISVVESRGLAAAGHLRWGHDRTRSSRRCRSRRGHEDG